MEFLEAVSRHTFMQHALLAAVLAPLGCGIIGTLVVVKRLSFYTGGIAHSLLAGLGLAHLLQFPPLLGALLASLAAALLIAYIHSRWRHQEDVLVTCLWASGMALGVLFLSRTPHYGADLMSYLFGNILLVSRGDLWLMASLDLCILILVIGLRRQFSALLLDEEFAAARGLCVEGYYLLLLCLVSLTVVLLLRVVGMVLLLALVTLPAATALLFARSLLGAMLGACVLGVTLTCIGLSLSYQHNLPAGSCIVLLCALGYLGAGLLRRLRS